MNKVLGLNKETIGNVLGVNKTAMNKSIKDINNAVAESRGITDAGLERSIDMQNAGVDRSIGIQDAATNRALGIQDAATERSVGALTDAEARGRADLAPWMQTGSQALEAYAGELGLTQPNGQPYVSKFRENPGYQFGSEAARWKDYRGHLRRPRPVREHTRCRDFATFRTEQAIAFKRSLSEQVNMRTGRKLSKATVYSTLNSLKDFFFWLASEPGYRSRLLHTDAPLLQSVIKGSSGGEGSRRDAGANSERHSYRRRSHAA